MNGGPGFIIILHPAQVEMVKKYHGGVLPDYYRIAKDLGFAEPKETPPQPMPPKGAQWKRERAGRRS